MQQRPPVPDLYCTFMLVNPCYQLKTLIMFIFNISLTTFPKNKVVYVACKLFTVDFTYYHVGN